MGIITVAFEIVLHAFPSTENLKATEMPLKFEAMQKMWRHIQI